MTLVVSDISRHGIVMVGDSAITTGGGAVQGRATKIHYAPAANVGFATWGDARVGDIYMDRWMADFAANQVQPGASVEVIGELLVATLNPLLEASGRPWKDMRRGIHLAGYRGGLPVLFHVHCGHEGEPSHQLQLYHDYPDDQGWSEQLFRANLAAPAFIIHLRNGYHHLFAPLFVYVLGYAAHLKQDQNIDFPRGTLQGRLDFYKTLVRFIAGMLDASHEHAGVNDQLSLIAFTQHGIVIDQRLPLSDRDPLSPGQFGCF